MLRQEEWLAQAKRLSVGMTARVKHGRERRANMVVGNDRGHWWAYCQACKQGGRLDKEHVLMALGTPLSDPSAFELLLPHDLRPVLGSDYEAVVGRFLASKGMMFPYLPKLWYSELTKRLCLQDDDGGWHGRDLTERSNAKWLHYGKPHIVGRIGKTTVVTEDLFSMYKVRFALREAHKPYCVATTLGAGCSVAAALALKDCTTIVWAYDGDHAGDEGFKSASKRMRVLVPKQVRARPPEGMDPKDMDCAEIRELIYEVL
ncbi:MAG TPA: hypothetical protein VM783_17960 [Candidatus Acidoferrum sp.]|nr:hypothetical protein [Candidatus Acidoferrum sp.]